MEAWILQILLTEVMGVPVTLETGKPDVKMDFHDENLSFGYGSGNDFGVLEKSLELEGDCTLAFQGGGGAEANGAEAGEESSSTTAYEPCAHFVPEVWTTQINRLRVLQDDGVIYKPEGLGVVGQMNWWIPRFTALRDPTLLTYFGLAGQENRQKLADIFKRPTTWGDYCSQVSLTACREPDGVAARAPVDDAEAGQYFDEIHYIGHFRKTEENDCETHPDTCTGHIADFPCGWSSYVEQQTWHLGIGLRSSGNEPGCRGYNYGELLDIFAAANATKSDIIFQWWTPDVLHNIYAGTDSEFQAVGMPLPTLDCIRNTVTSVERCDPDPEVRRGSPEGACGEPPYPLQKVYSDVLFDITKGDDIPAARHNPAYDVFKAFSLTSLDVSDLYDSWFASDKTFTGFDLRHATCEWMVDNWDLMENFIPRDFPRVPLENKRVKFDEALFVVVLVLALVAGGAILVTAVFTHIRRNDPAIKGAQPGFLRILIVGLFFVAAGGVLEFMPPSNATCTVIPWLINLGYTLEIIPLIAKVAAIQKLMQAARSMRRIKLDIRHLYAVVLGICFVVVIFMTLWSILDAPRKAFHSGLTKEQTSQGETIILMTAYCKSESDIWRYMAAGWQTILLVAATLLAFQTRKLKTDFGETETLGMMVYSHFVFLGLRIIIYALEGDGKEADIALYRSMIYSCDILLAVCIYFVPKFFHKWGNKGIVDLRSTAAIPATMRANFAQQASDSGFRGSGRQFEELGPLRFGVTYANDDDKNNNMPPVTNPEGGVSRFSKTAIRDSIAEKPDEESEESSSAGTEELQEHRPSKSAAGDEDNDILKRLHSRLPHRFVTDTPSPDSSDSSPCEA